MKGNKSIADLSLFKAVSAELEEPIWVSEVETIRYA
jgi:hypothetical protein